MEGSQGQDSGGESGAGLTAVPEGHFLRKFPQPPAHTLAHIQSEFPRPWRRPRPAVRQGLPSGQLSGQLAGQLHSPEKAVPGDSNWPCPFLVEFSMTRQIE